MTISPIGSAAPIQAEQQPSVSKAPVPQTHGATPPAYTVSLSSSAQKTAGGDPNHDGDSN